MRITAGNNVGNQNHKNDGSISLQVTSFGFMDKQLDSTSGGIIHEHEIKY